MAQMTLSLHVKFRWWLWPAVYALTWGAYPVLAFCDEATVDRYIDWVCQSMVPLGLKTTTKAAEAAYTVTLD